MLPIVEIVGILRAGTPQLSLVTGLLEAGHVSICWSRANSLTAGDSLLPKVVALTDCPLGHGRWRVTLRLPALNDAKLLLAALVWPPSCFVSDATAKTGEIGVFHSF